MKRSLAMIISEPCINEYRKSKIARLEKRLAWYEDILDKCHIDLGELSRPSDVEDDVLFCNGCGCDKGLFEGDGFSCGHCGEVYCEDCAKECFVSGGESACRHCRNGNDPDSETGGNAPTIITKDGFATVVPSATNVVASSDEGGVSRQDRCSYHK